MVKKVLFFLVFLTIVAGKGYCQNNVATVSAGEAVAGPSETSVTVTLSLNTQQPVAGYQFTLIYDSSIIRARSARNGSLYSGLNIRSNLETPGQARIAGFDPNLQGISGSGSLVILTFDIIRAGTSGLVFSNVSLSDKESRAINATTLNGRVTIAEETGDREISERETPQETTPPGQPQAVPRTGREERFTNGAGALTEQSGRILRQAPERTRTQPAQRQRETAPTLEQRTETLSPSSNNPVLMVKSEYGNPTPPVGYTTFRTGTQITCRVDEEIFISNTEKAVCKGFKGSGSLSSGTSNKTVFTIERDTVIEWLWETKPAGKDFSVEFKGESKAENVVIIPVSATYYGGLEGPIELSVKTIPGFIRATIENVTITNETPRTEIKVAASEEAPAGQYEIEIKASCGEIEKTYTIPVAVKGILESSLKKEGNISTLSVIPFKNMQKTESLLLKVRFSPQQVKPLSVSPESVDYKMSGRDILAVAASGKEERIEILFDDVSHSDKINVEIISAKARDKNGRLIPVTIK